MTSAVITARTNTSLLDLIGLMLENHISALPITNGLMTGIRQIRPIRASINITRTTRPTTPDGA